jgi:hypothetical protein
MLSASLVMLMLAEFAPFLSLPPLWLDVASGMVEFIPSASGLMSPSLWFAPELVF